MSDESKGAVKRYSLGGGYQQVKIDGSRAYRPIRLDEVVAASDYDALAARLAAAEARVAEVEGERVPMPAGLHQSTKQLVVKFAKAMAAKLRRAEMRYGYSDEWANAENIDGMRREFWSHADKGDPVDVANFAAFLWHHSQSTCGNPLAAANAELQAEIDRINDAQAASLGAEIVRLTAANAAQAREIERLRGIVDRLPKTADGVVRLVDDPVWLRYETETTRVIRGRVCYRGDEAVGYFAEDRDGDNFIDWSDEYPVSECFATEDAARRGAVVPRGDSPAAVDPRAALLHIATMDVFTRDGEELPHETMRRIALAALAPAADASGEVTP